jgi:hypothetical protein
LIKLLQQLDGIPEEDASIGFVRFGEERCPQVGMMSVG